MISELTFCPPKSRKLAPLKAAPIISMAAITELTATRPVRRRTARTATVIEKRIKASPSAPWTASEIAPEPIAQATLRTDPEK